MSTREERQNAVMDRIPGIMIQIANPAGPNWEMADLLASEIVDIASSPEQAVGDAIATVTGYFVRLCRHVGIDPIPLLRELAQEQAARDPGS